jgi:hypothetical protein
MLKIENGINLTKLEKFGLSPRYDYKTGKIIEYVDDFERYIRVNADVNSQEYKTISFILNSEKIIEEKSYEILFNLIKAKLVKIDRPINYGFFNDFEKSLITNRREKNE